MAFHRVEDGLREVLSSIPRMDVEMMLNVALGEPIRVDAERKKGWGGHTFCRYRVTLSRGGAEHVLQEKELTGESHVEVRVPTMQTMLCELGLGYVPFKERVEPLLGQDRVAEYDRRLAKMASEAP